MPRILFNLKFWALALCLVWIVAVTAIILNDPASATSVK